MLATGVVLVMMLPKDPKQILVDTFLWLSLAVMLAKVLWAELKSF